MNDLESDVGRMGTANDIQREADIQSGREAMAGAQRAYAGTPALSLGSGSGGKIGPIQGSATFGSPWADATFELKDPPKAPPEQTQTYTV